MLARLPALALIALSAVDALPVREPEPLAPPHPVPDQSLSNFVQTRIEHSESLTVRSPEGGQCASDCWGPRQPVKSLRAELPH